MANSDSSDEYYDVIIAGSGNAGFSAALSAKEHGAQRVLIVDKCPEEWAGGNTYFTAGAYRTVFDNLEDVLGIVQNVDKETARMIDMKGYSKEDFWSDLMHVTNGRADRELGRVLIDESRATIGWLVQKGVKFRLSFNRQAYKVDGRHKFWGGMVLATVDGGKGLVAQLQAAARRDGVHIRYSTPVTGLSLDVKGRVNGIIVNGKSVIRSKTVILCCGGYEASPQLRAQYLGPNWDLAHVRGTPYNTGDGLEFASRDVSAKLTGNFSSCHSVCWDANSPANTGDRTLTNQFTKSGYPFGLMLNQNGLRFVDEGVDLRNFTYAKFGRQVLQQPGSMAFQVWDATGSGWLREEEYADDVVQKVYAETIEELAEKLAAKGLEDKTTFSKTVHEYNHAVHAFSKANPTQRFDPSIKDGLSTQSPKVGLTLSKSNWALPLEKAPFMAIKITCGITFTFGGLCVNPATAAVLSKASGREILGLYAAGEIVGGLFYSNYPGGSGLTIGAILGRKAGKSAGKETRDPGSRDKAVRAML